MAITNKGGTINWNFNAEADGYNQGKATAAANSRNANQWQQLQSNNAIARENERRQATAQDKAADTLYQQQAGSFYVSGNKPVNYDALNVMFDGATNKMADIFHTIVTNDDLSPREKSEQSGKFLRQVPLLGSARTILSQRVKDYQAAAMSGDISGAMSPADQEFYASLADGSFKGGMVPEGDSMVFKGTYGDGTPYRLPLQDFELKLPSVTPKGGDMTDAMDGISSAWKTQKMKFDTTGLEKDLPVWDPEKIKDDALETITGDGSPGSGYGSDGGRVFAMDTMGRSSEDWTAMVDNYKDNEQPVFAGGVSKEQWDAFTPELKAKFPMRMEKMTRVDAENAAMDDLLDDYVSAIKSTWDTSKYTKGKVAERDLTKAELKDQRFVNSATEDINTLTEAINTGDSKALLQNITGPEGTKGGFANFVQEGNIIKYNLITGTKDNKGEDGNVVSQSPINGETIVIDLNNVNDIERFYKENLKHSMSDATSKNRINAIWEEEKDGVIENIRNNSNKKLLAEKEQALLDKKEEKGIGGKINEPYNTKWNIKKNKPKLTEGNKEDLPTE